MPIVITKNTLQPNLREYDERAIRALRIVLDYWSNRAVTQMRTNASWTDRTTNARNGLAAKRYDENDGGSIVLYHTMHYGIWLEVRWSGEYAIIGPTLNDISPKVLKMAAEAIKRAG